MKRGKGDKTVYSICIIHVCQLSMYLCTVLQELLLLGAASGSPLYCFHMPITLYGFMLRKDIYIYIYIYNTGSYATVITLILYVGIYIIQVHTQLL